MRQRLIGNDEPRATDMQTAAIAPYSVVKFIARHHITKRIMLHTSAATFAIDMVHTFAHRAMICDAMWVAVRDPMIAWASFAAVAIVYFDKKE